MSKYILLSLLRSGACILTAMFMVCGLSTQAQNIATDYKGNTNVNPISASVFCADPTAIDFEGRLYVYGSNDHQQFIQNDKTGSNGYGDIQSLVVFSTDDMVNWTFHGTIDVKKICGSWCGQSWAPSAVWRTTEKGANEFFIYFSNGAGSIGVIKGSSPIGPFKSPRSSALITHSTPGVDPCCWVFDPGVVIDDNGTGWIAFGGGDPQETGSKMMPGNARIAKLKSSMTAIDGSAVEVPAPYMFEASELNMMNGRYVYTFNTSWSDRDDWSAYEGRGNYAEPSGCSMCYMVSDNPLDPTSWEYRGEYVPNEGNFGMGYGNNHTHLHKFNDTYYLFYHSSLLEQAMNTGASGFRSLCVNKASVNENTQKIKKLTLSKTGITAIKNLNPYQWQEAETMASSGGVSYEDFTNITKNTTVSTLGNDASRNLQVKMAAGSWISVRKVDFGTTGANTFTFRAKGSGTVQIRLGSMTAVPAATLEFSSNDMTEHTFELDTEKFKNVKSMFLVFTEATDVQFDAWCFTEQPIDGIEKVNGKSSNSQWFDLSGQRLPRIAKSGIVIERHTTPDNKSVVRKHILSH